MHGGQARWWTSCSWSHMSRAFLGAVCLHKYRKPHTSLISKDTNINMYVCYERNEEGGMGDTGSPEACPADRYAVAFCHFPSR